MASDCGSYLVLMAGALAVLSDGLQRLSHQVHVALVNVKSQQAEASGGASADAIEELQSLTHQVVVGFVVLAAQEVLNHKERIKVSPLIIFTDGGDWCPRAIRHKYLQIRVVVLTEKLQVA